MSIENAPPKPLVLAPSGTHQTSVILLHGRGRSADVFVSEMAFLQQVLPDTKFIFPWAPKQRATVYKKSITRQWFDDWHLNPDLQSTDVVHVRYDEGLQISGLGDTVAYLHDLIGEEARGVGGAQNVVLGGFSQGAAASLVAALLWDGEQRLGGVVAISAWLPYVSQMADLLRRKSDEETPHDGAKQDKDDFDPFERILPQDDGVDRNSEGTEFVLEWLREQVDLQQTKNQRLHEDLGDSPVMFYHGLSDDKVPPERSLEAQEHISCLGLKFVERKTYPGVGHEISSNMTADIAAFLRSTLGEGNPN